MKVPKTPARFGVTLYYDWDVEKVDALFAKPIRDIIDVLKKIEAERPDIVEKVAAKFGKEE